MVIREDFERFLSAIEEANNTNIIQLFVEAAAKDDEIK